MPKARSKAKTKIFKKKDYMEKTYLQRQQLWTIQKMILDPKYRKLI